MAYMLHSERTGQYVISSSLPIASLIINYYSWFILTVGIVSFMFSHAMGHAKYGYKLIMHVSMVI